MLFNIDLIPELLSNCGIMWSNGEPCLVIAELGRFSSERYRSHDPCVMYYVVIIMTKEFILECQGNSRTGIKVSCVFTALLCLLSMFRVYCYYCI